MKHREKHQKNESVQNVAFCTDFLPLSSSGQAVGIQGMLSFSWFQTDRTGEPGEFSEESGQMLRENLTEEGETDIIITRNESLSTRESKNDITENV